MFAIVVLPAAAATAQAGWLIDAEKYHVSAHGQLACGECHTETGKGERHPDPLEVTRSPRDFFDPHQCAACHDDVLDDIAEGGHGGEAVTPWRSLKDCLECHDPHYEKNTRNSGEKVDLTWPAEKKCSHCHEYEATLPDPAPENRECLDCHYRTTRDQTETHRQITDLCFHCHAAPLDTEDSWFRYPLVAPSEYASTPHAMVNCLVCHPRAAAYEHSAQPLGDCVQCHPPHDEKTAHDAHAIVACGACHLKGVTPVKDAAAGGIRWQKPPFDTGYSRIHEMAAPQKEESCMVCHAQGNALGAAAMVLPAKSVLCMPCHTATFSVSDAVTALSLVLFLAGLMAAGAIWFSGGEAGLGLVRKSLQTTRALARALFSRRLVPILMALFLDGLLQRRLFRVSRERWLLHAMIFYPFVFRFLWGLTGLIASLAWPQWTGTWVLVDKNHPFTAFLFDFTAFGAIIGIIGMFLLRRHHREAGNIANLPPADWPAYALLGGIIFVGFLLEGMRMSMTGSPGGAPYAFMGDLLARLLAGVELTGVYGYVWHLHAVLTGAFLVYLPFSRMFHMLTAPVVLAMNAATKSHKKGD